MEKEGFTKTNIRVIIIQVWFIAELYERTQKNRLKLEPRQEG